MTMRVLALLLLLIQEPVLKEVKDLKAAFNESKERARMMVILAPC